MTIYGLDFASRNGTVFLEVTIKSFSFAYDMSFLARLVGWTCPVVLYRGIGGSWRVMLDI